MRADHGGTKRTSTPAAFSSASRSSPGTSMLSLTSGVSPDEVTTIQRRVTGTHRPTRPGLSGNAPAGRISQFGPHTQRKKRAVLVTHGA